MTEPHKQKPRRSGVCGLRRKKAGGIDCPIRLHELGERWPTSLLAGITSPDFSRLLDLHRVSLDRGRNLLQQRGVLFHDKDFDARLTRALPLSRAHDAGQRHQAVGVLFQDGFNRL